MDVECGVVDGTIVIEASAEAPALADTIATACPHASARMSAPGVAPASCSASEKPLKCTELEDVATGTAVCRGLKRTISDCAAAAAPGACMTLGSVSFER